MIWHLHGAGRRQEGREVRKGRGGRKGWPGEKEVKKGPAGEGVKKAAVARRKKS